MTSEERSYAREDLFPKVREVMEANKLSTLGFKYDHRGIATITQISPDLGPAARETVINGIQRDFREEIRSYYSDLQGQDITCLVTPEVVNWGGALGDE